MVRKALFSVVALFFLAHGLDALAVRVHPNPRPLRGRSLKRYLMKKRLFRSPQASYVFKAGGELSGEDKRGRTYTGTWKVDKNSVRIEARPEETDDERTQAPSGAGADALDASWSNIRLTRSGALVIESETGGAVFECRKGSGNETTGRVGCMQSLGLQLRSGGGNRRLYRKVRDWFEKRFPASQGMLVVAGPPAGKSHEISEIVYRGKEQKIKADFVAASLAGLLGPIEPRPADSPGPFAVTVIVGKRPKPAAENP